MTSADRGHDRQRPTSSTGRGGNSCACSRRRRRARRARATRAALLPLLSQPAEGARARAGACACTAKCATGHFGREIVHPQFKVIDAGVPLPDRLTPVYPTTAGLGQETLRKLVARALASDPALTGRNAPRLARRQAAPVEVRRRRALPARAAAAARPTHAARAGRAHASGVDAAQVRRAARAAALAQGASQGARRAARAGADRHRRAHGRLLARVPFKLTRAQEKVWREISHDLKRATPMQRLLQGDVGSGKTVVAALAALQAIESGRQVAFMAPTEILAEQHYRKLTQWLEGLPVNVAWLPGATAGEGAPRSARGDRERRRDARRRDARAVRGRSRAAAAGPRDRRRAAPLRRRAAAEVARQGRWANAHQLMMSATPIPRTLAMTFYADLDVSVLDEMPPGRTPVKTHLVNNRRRAEIVLRVRKACAEGRQAYWVCPLIEESEKLELQDGGRAARGARGDTGSGDRGRAPAREDEAGRKSEGDGRFRREEDRRAGRDDGDRGRRRRAQCIADGDRARRAVRPRATAPVARPGRPRRRRERVLPAVRGAAHRHREGTAQGDLREQRRLRDRACRPR